MAVRRSPRDAAVGPDWSRGSVVVRVHHSIRLTSRDGFGGEAPPVPVGNLLRQIKPAVRESIMMGLVGRSRPPGRPPAWLVSASDVRFIGIEGESQGDTVLHFEAPRLGEAAEELYQQQEFWPSKPPAEDTGFDLLGDVLSDVAAHRADSDRFDSPLLKRIGGFGKILHGVYQRASLTGHRYTDQQPAVLDGNTIANALRLDFEMPMPQRVRVVGNLDMIRLSSRGFELILDDGTLARGVLIEGDMAALKPLVGHRALVQGEAFYRPSGRLLRIDAARVDPGEDQPGIWSVIPPPRRRKLDTRQLLKRQGPSSGISAFFGTWPGDETDEEWEEMIERLS
jgi:hypothetical protein